LDVKRHPILAVCTFVLSLVIALAGEVWLMGFATEGARMAGF
jgi:hypothetical protein